MTSLEIRCGPAAAFSDGNAIASAERPGKSSCTTSRLSIYKEIANFSSSASNFKSPKVSYAQHFMDGAVDCGIASSVTEKSRGTRQRRCLFEITSAFTHLHRLSGRSERRSRVAVSQGGPSGVLGNAKYSSASSHGDGVEPGFRFPPSPSGISRTHHFALDYLVESRLSLYRCLLLVVFDQFLCVCQLTTGRFIEGLAISTFDNRFQTRDHS
jgi:hypothetical protein